MIRPKRLLFLLYFLAFSTPISGQGSQSQGLINIVFHILKHPNDERLEMDRIKSQIDVLNEDFNAKNHNLAAIPEEFRPSIGNAKISFDLAKYDPDGIPTNGVNFIDTDILNIGDQVSSDGRRLIQHTILGGNDAWDPSRYLNIWIGAKADILAESSFPDDAGNSDDGIIIDPKFIGRINNKNTPLNLGRILTHEIGHYLGLKHPWGDSNNCENDDGYADTPDQSQIYFGCPSHPAISCGSADMFMNFMNFCDDACLSFFTKDQVDHMKMTLFNERQGLLSPVDVPEFSSIDLKYQINPSHVLVSVDTIFENQTFIELWDINGKIWKKLDFTSKYFLQINTNDIPLGVYILRLDNTQGSKSIKLFFGKITNP